ncbi:guanine nucleotide exchange factor [Anaeramoeba ignava]|uniref:Guanine nucleotide exchange factor n=1 Tax=Anaeramoeba ignava TaxID=1746090 RepID=A0A9Q0L5E8_ANAIG|nr:guanine nucleotide exchange factor [Anaeramoeba ignava]|eukprot:Anaeramoba_ignava/a611523_24.p1 GENE.a611523_24~~a611523_24.p1  ORF type:complete len:861 (-),score=243.35 a611523_24:129-2711(-)
MTSINQEKQEEKTIEVKLLNNQTRTITVSKTTTTENILEKIYEERTEEMTNLGLYGYSADSTAFNLEEMMTGGKLFIKEDLIFENSNYQFQVVHAPPSQIEIMVGENEISDTNNEQIVDATGQIMTILQNLCKKKKVSVNDYGLFLVFHEKGNVSVTDKKERTFLPLSHSAISKSQNNIIDEILRDTHLFGIWLDPNQEKQILFYIHQNIWRTGSMFLKFQPKPAHISIIIPAKYFPNSPDSKKEPTKLELLIDLTKHIDQVLEELCSFYNLVQTTKQGANDTKINYVLLYVEYRKEENQKNNQEQYIVSELVPLKKGLSLASQGVFSNSTLKLIGLIQNTQEQKKNVPQNQSDSSQESYLNISENMNFWDEMASGFKNIIWGDEKGKDDSDNEEPLIGLISDKIKAASLNKSIEILTSPEYFSTQSVEMFVDLLPTITDPVTFINKLIERYQVPEFDPITLETITEEAKNIIQIYVVKVIEEIVEKNRFRLPKTVKSIILDFCKDGIDKNPNQQISFEAKQIENFLLHKSDTLDSRLKNFDAMTMNENITDEKTDKKNTNRKKSGQGQKSPSQTPQGRLRSKSLPKMAGNVRTRAPAPKLPSQTDVRKLTFMDIHVVELARQLTLQSQKLFSKVKIRELMKMAWTDKNKKETAPHVVKLIQRFNNLSDWTTTEILKETTDNKRIKIVSRFIKIAHRLFEMQNFNDMMALMSGMQISPIHRLKKMWERIPEKQMTIFKQLDELTNALSGYKRLRDKMLRCSLPLIPYLGVYLADLAFIEELPDFLSANLINWAKKRRLYTTIKTIQTYQSVKFNFLFISDISQFLDSVTVIRNENVHWDLSVKIEPFPNHNKQNSQLDQQ